MRAVEGWREVGERVRNVRLAHGLSQAELAARLGIDRTAVVRIEAGERQVSALELGRLADILRVPVAHFVTKPPSSVTSYRSAISDELDSSARVRLLLDVDLETHARDAEWLVEQGALEIPTTQAIVGQAGDATAAVELARSTRRAIEKPSGPLGPLSEVAEVLGLFIRVLKRDVAGASLQLRPGFGVAVIGGESPPGRRRWTAAHEIGHHITGDAYHSDAGVAASESERESVIDAFADELLLPRNDVLAAWSAAGSTDPRTTLIELAARYRLSWSATVSAVRQAGLIDADQSQQLRANSPLRGDFLEIVGYEPDEDLRPGTTGPLWNKAVLAAWHNGAVSAQRAVDLLGGAITIDELPQRELAEGQ